MNRYVIHIPGCSRHSQMISEMDSQYKGEYKIFEAITDQKGSKGISMSFKKIIIENYQEPAVHIFEDDIKFTTPNSRKIFSEVMKTLPNNWDIFLGGSYFDYDENPIEIDYAAKGFIKVFDFCSLHNVVIRKSAYDKILAHDVDVQENIDRWIGQLSKNGKLNVFLCDPQIAIQYPGHSYNIGRKQDYSYRLKKMNILYED